MMYCFRNIAIILVFLFAATSLSHAQTPSSSPDVSPIPVSPMGQPPMPPSAGGGLVALPPPDNVVSAVPARSPADLKSQKAMEALEAELNKRLSFLKPSVDPKNLRSLLFNQGEHDLIVAARKGLLTNIGEVEEIKVEGNRDISLGGIVYKSSGNWTIWLNNTRMTPKALMNEIMNLKVYKDYIELEWFDSATNQIFPIRLRPHQRFNLDTRIFLPG